MKPPIMFSPNAAFDSKHTNDCNGLQTSYMKSTKVQTLGAVTLHATTACTDEASIVGLSPLNWAIV